jgi:hypothetical protein
MSSRCFLQLVTYNIGMATNDETGTIDRLIADKRCPVLWQFSARRAVSLAG